MSTCKLKIILQWLCVYLTKRSIQLEYYNFQQKPKAPQSNGTADLNKVAVSVPVWLPAIAY